jgi:hypothetical protein
VAHGISKSRSQTATGPSAVAEAAVTHGLNPSFGQVRIAAARATDTTRDEARRTFISVPSIVSINARWIVATMLQKMAAEREGTMTRYVVLVIAVGILGGSIQTSADEAISITVRPAVTSFRGNAQLKVLVSRNEKNRILVWEVDGPNYYRSSSIMLDGAAAARSYFFTVRDLPAGEFDVRATVKRNDSSAAVDRSTITVIGGPG